MKLTFTAAVWLYAAEKAAWHFVTLPAETAARVKAHTGHLRRGWGSVPVGASIHGIAWQTSLFPDKKSDSYLLPLKADVRKQAGIREGDAIHVTLTIASDFDDA